jgi:hypothetical protein
MVSLEFFIDIILLAALWPLGLTQPLTKMSTRNIFLAWSWPLRSADNLTTFVCRSSWNPGASTSWNPLGLSRPVMGLLYLYLSHSVCIIYMYINVCVRMHTHCEPWHHRVHGLAMGLVSSHHAWILGNTTAKMSSLADLCKLYSTLKWLEDNDFLCYWSILLLHQEAKCHYLSFF